MRTAIRRATTPPNLLGIDRRMAYAQRKYHSGLMWIGVTSGLAGMKFSGSVKREGLRSVRKIIKREIRKNPNRSFDVK